MKHLLVILCALITFSAFSQKQFYTDFDNYSFNPALTGPDSKLEADVLYQSDFINVFGTADNVIAQFNQSFGKNNLGFNFIRLNYRGSLSRVNARANYVRNIQLGKAILQPVVSVGFHRNKFKRSTFFNTKLDESFHAISASLGIGVHYKNFHAGIFGDNLITEQIDEYDFYSDYLSPDRLFNFHFAYDIRIHQKFDATPFLRGFFTEERRNAMNAGVNVTYYDLIEVWLANKWEFNNMYANGMKAAIGFAPIPNFWIRYQYQLNYSSVYDPIYSEPSHLLGISFNLPKETIK